MQPSYLLHGSSINTRETSSKKLYLSIPHATQVPTTTVVNLEAEGGQLMHSSLVLLPPAQAPTMADELQQLPQ